MTLLTSPRDMAFAESEGLFSTADGIELFYRHWKPAEPSGRAILLFHRGHEHSGRFGQLVNDLKVPDCHFFAWDARGHGRSPGERGYAKSFATVVDDMDRYVRFISKKHGIDVKDMLIIGHSVGAVAAAAWVHDYAPAIRGMVLVTPAFRVKLYVPLALPVLRLRNRLGKSFIKSYVRAKMLTHDPEQAAAYQSDPLISRNIATNVLLDLHDTATRLLADAGAIRVPTLMLAAGSDWVVKNSAQQEFFSRLGSTIKQQATFNGFYHAMLHEKDRAKPIALIREFIQSTFAAPDVHPGLLNGDAYTRDEFTERAVAAPDVHPGLLNGDAYTRREFEALSKPLPITSPRWWSFRAQTIAMKTLLRLSAGVRLGWRTGFDSGESLDYVYQNRPRGISPLGKFIDRQYLNAIGWTGIRIRKMHLMQLLKQAIALTRQADQPVRILDIAGGGGRYVLEVLANEPDATALIRDRSLTALATARESAKAMELANVAFAEGDAFDEASIASVTPPPTIAIVSGLHELFGDNTPVRASLGGLARALAPGAYLIYTNQPWHPQIEMIARVLTNRDGKPWIMRRRTQAEMDQLVQSAGFEKLEMKIDKFGIFTVSLAVRLGE